MRWTQFRLLRRDPHLRQHTPTSVVVCGAKFVIQIKTCTCNSSVNSPYVLSIRHLHTSGSYIVYVRTIVYYIACVYLRGASECITNCHPHTLTPSHPHTLTPSRSTPVSPSTLPTTTRSHRSPFTTISSSVPAAAPSNSGTPTKDNLNRSVQQNWYTYNVYHNIQLETFVGESCREWVYTLRKKRGFAKLLKSCVEVEYFIPSIHAFIMPQCLSLSLPPSLFLPPPSLPRRWTGPTHRGPPSPPWVSCPPPSLPCWSVGAREVY